MYIYRHADVLSKLNFSAGASPCLFSNLVQQQTVHVFVFVFLSFRPIHSESYWKLARPNSWIYLYLSIHVFIEGLIMPKYFCDYCDTYLTHDSPSVRKTHCAGRKHRENVKFYYEKWYEQNLQKVQKLQQRQMNQFNLLQRPPPMPPPGTFPARLDLPPPSLTGGLPAGPPPVMANLMVPPPSMLNPLQPPPSMTMPPPNLMVPPPPGPGSTLLPPPSLSIPPPGMINSSMPPPNMSTTLLPPPPPTHLKRD